MSLKNLELKIKYRSNTDENFRDFYNKCLQVSNRYDRAVGYFSSSSIPVIARGLEKFIDGKGKIRMVCNPQLSCEDVEAIALGKSLRKDLVEKKIISAIDFLNQTMSEDPLNTLAWLIYQGILDIKIAYTSGNSIYHEKFGIFYDGEGNKVVFSGSSNETYSGLVSNFEKIDVYFRENDKDRIEDAIKDFEDLWCDRTDGIEIIDFPIEAKEKILKYKKEKPATKSSGFEERQYQKEAIESLKENGWCGIFDMATGTGKTITSLLCARKYMEENNRIFLVVFVPYQHLVDQWEETLNMFEFSKPVKCFDSRNKWTEKLRGVIRDYNIGLTRKECIIAVYDTAKTKHFQQIINNVKMNRFLISDECHNFGSNSFKKHDLIKFDAKLGLSATPQRWWDERGTERIMEFFKGIVYTYDIERALKESKLVKYNYNPIIVDLDTQEIENYEKLTAEITKLILSKDKRHEDRISRLSQERSLIISRASMKTKLFIEKLREKKPDEVSHTLVYCAPGQVDEITSLLYSLNLQVSRFDSRVSKPKRLELLKRFDKGEIQILVAIRCLDEGVDVPSTKEAYFLASTSNPREFVQRRGRILRKCSRKNKAFINDFIVLPQSASPSMFKAVVLKEMPRFAEFSLHSIDRFIARGKIRRILEKYELEYLMDKLPWEVYEEMKLLYGGNDEDKC